MNKPLPLHSPLGKEIEGVFLEKKWKREGDQLLYLNQPIFCLKDSEDEAALQLLPSAAASKKMLAWFFAPGLLIREATLRDLEEVCHLKEEIIRSHFSFFSQREMAEALERSASLTYMKEEIERNHFLLAMEENKIHALAGLQFLNQQEALLYSLYSKGDRAGAALISKLLLLAREEGLQFVASNVYRENDLGRRALEQFGFSLEDKPQRSTYVAGYLIDRLVLEL